MRVRKPQTPRDARGEKPASPPSSGRRSRVDGAGLRTFFAAIARRHPDRSGVLFLCIGTDRSSGDAYGPLVGTLLAEAGFPLVAGTLDCPFDADRLAGPGVAIPDGVTVVAVDACLGQPMSVGAYLTAEGPLRPAEAVRGAYGAFGHYSVAGVVNKTGPRPYAALQAASLGLVLRMARETAEAAAAAWPAAVRPAGLADNPQREQTDRTEDERKNTP